MTFENTGFNNRMYKEIIDKLKARHQLCIAHLYRMIGNDLYKILRRKNVSYRDKLKFRTYNDYIAIERLERLLDNFEDIPRILQIYIQKKILPDFERLTVFMRDGLISRTSNPVENYHRQTDPEEIKKKYKTFRGILSYLERKENGLLDCEAW